MQKNIAPIFVTVVLIIISICAWNVSRNQSLGSFETSNAYTAAQTSTGVLVTTSNTVVLATSTSRSFVRISNLSGNTIYCNTDNGKPATAFQGYMISATSSLSFSDNDSNLYRGAINCIAIGGSASTTVFQR